MDLPTLLPVPLFLSLASGSALRPSPLSRSAADSSAAILLVRSSQEVRILSREVKRFTSYQVRISRCHSRKRSFQRRNRRTLLLLIYNPCIRPRTSYAAVELHHPAAEETGQHCESEVLGQHHHCSSRGYARMAQ